MGARLSGVGSACIAAAAILLIGTRVAADCASYEYEILDLALERVTVNGQPDGDLSRYDDWTLRVEARPDPTPHVRLTAMQAATDDYCSEEFR